MNIYHAADLKIKYTKLENDIRNIMQSIEDEKNSYRFSICDLSSVRSKLLQSSNKTFFDRSDFKRQENEIESKLKNTDRILCDLKVKLAEKSREKDECSRNMKEAEYKSKR